jgi:hypothetical protein
VKDYISHINGEAYSEDLYRYFNPNDISRWLREPPLTIIQFMRSHIIQAASLTVRYSELYLKMPDFDQIHDFNLSNDLNLRRILNLIIIDSRLINSTMSATELYWQTFLLNEKIQYIYNLTTPQKIIEEVITHIESPNLRIRGWGQYLMDNPAIDVVKILDQHKNFTFKYAIEVIIANSYVIEVVITTCKQYHQALLDGRVTWDSPNV